MTNWRRILAVGAVACGLWLVATAVPARADGPYRSTTITSTFVSLAPTIDGAITPGEWDDATLYDITHLTQAPLSVTVRVLNDAAHLYLAFENPNDTSDDYYDQVVVGFDDNPLPSDGHWSLCDCSRLDGEGHLYLEDTEVVFVPFQCVGEWPPCTNTMRPAPGVQGVLSHASGHAQSELVIDLNHSPLRAEAGQTVNMHLGIYDDTADAWQGIWGGIVEEIWDFPHDYQPLVLAARWTAPEVWLADLGNRAGGWTSQDATPRLVGDVNGDGLADLVGLGTHNVLVALSDGTGFLPKQIWLARSFCRITGWTSQDTFPRFMADVNGDARADLVGFGDKQVFVALSTGTSFAPQQVWLDRSLCRITGWSSQDIYPRLLGDLNGDGSADIVGFGYRAVYVSLSTGSSFAPQQVWLRNSLCRIKGWSSQDVYPRLLADVTGDGQADIVGFGQRAICVAPSLTDRLGAQEIWQWDGFCQVTDWTSWGTYPRFVADADGDGRADVLGLGDASGQVSLSSGAAFGARRVWLERSYCLATGWSDQDTYPRFLVDVTGDGRGDLVGFGPRGVFVSAGQ